MAAHRSCTQGKGSLLVNRTTHHLAVRFLFHGNGFPGDHGLIDITLAFKHQAVDGHSLSWAHFHDIALRDLRDRNIDQIVGPHYMSNLGLQADQALYG